MFGRALGLLLLVATTASAGSFALFESDPVRPIVLSSDSRRLYALNIPDGRLEILSVSAAGLVPLASVPVGLDPVAVALRSDSEAWVVNHVSDSISIVDVAADPPRVVRTLLVGDEPRDVVFAGPQRRRAFITTAHRGQNSPVLPQLDVPGVGRADVWVFDAELARSSPQGTPEIILTLFGDTPRALTVSPDGNTVYAAVFKSGNQTTAVSAFAVCDGGELASPCMVQGKEMPGGLPAPNVNFEGQPQPRTALLVKHDVGSGAWIDAIGRDWRNAVPIALPDKDVFAIDASADPPREIDAYRGVGTVIYAMATNPLSGHLYVAATEARNDLRLEPNLRGHLHESWLTVVDAAGVHPRRLNKHIDYAQIPSSPATRDKSLALPNAIAVTRDGAYIWMAAMGSNRLAVLPTAELEDDTREPSTDDFVAVSGGGPVGLVLDEEHGKAYVLTRFDNGIATVDMQERRETAHLQMYSPEPADVQAGRRFLYDAAHTSSNGEAACASCHVSGGDDALAWDLGDPDFPFLNNPNPRNPLVSIDPRLGPFFTEFHPLKGPLTTQSLRGLAHHAPMHWRGDRTGAFAPGGDAHDDRAALRQFNGAFVSLMGRASVLQEDELDALATFLLQITPPPNPHRNLDNSFTPAQQSSRDEFFRAIEGISCATCHVTDADAGIFGSDRSSSINGQSAQLMKVPSLRQTYQKVGMFGMFPQLSGFMPSGTGDQVRGFGFLHDGATGVFIRRTFDYVMAFDTNLAPIVGQQVTWTALDDAGSTPRLELLQARAAAGECELTVKGALGNRARGWLRQEIGDFSSDSSREETIGYASLQDLARTQGAALTFTCVPVGSGRRIAIDRDEDGYLDGDELDAGSNPGDPASIPAPTPSATHTQTAPATPTYTSEPTPTPQACAGDCDNDAVVTFAEITSALRMALEGANQAGCQSLDQNQDGEVTIEELVRTVGASEHACGTAVALESPTEAKR